MIGCKKNRRFSFVRIFGSNSSSNNNNGLCSSSTSIENIPAHYRPGQQQKQPHSPQQARKHTDNFQSKLLRERRNSIASMSDNSVFRPVSLESTKSRPFLYRGLTSQSSKQEPVEMNEKMRQFDELLQTHRSGTIRISLTPSLLQGP
ncbi:hypothetical protein BGZ83_003254 [Gryganskiella cystojenkinii]|nr:hypothetical protein BGZ83_003254 [Gryganskiella cystojenkinii]